MPAFVSESMTITFDLIFKIIHERKGNKVNTFLLNFVEQYDQ